MGVRVEEGEVGGGEGGGSLTYTDAALRGAMKRGVTLASTTYARTTFVSKKTRTTYTLYEYPSFPFWGHFAGFQTSTGYLKALMFSIGTPEAV